MHDHTTPLTGQLLALRKHLWAGPYPMRPQQPAQSRDRQSEKASSSHSFCCGCNLQWEGREEKSHDSLPTHTSQDIIHPSKQDTESKSPITFLVKRWQKAQNGFCTLLEGWGETPTEEKPLLSFQISCISFQGHIWNNLEQQTPWKFTAHDNLK